MERKQKAGEDSAISSLPEAKRGRPLLLGDTLDNQVKEYVRGVREGGGILTTEITIAAAKAIVQKYDPQLLAEDKGPITIKPDWAKSLLYHMHFVKRRGSTTTKQLVDDFEAIKIQFLADLITVKLLQEVPDDLVLNWDHIGINVVPGSAWTLYQKGKKWVELLALDDKRQITAVMCGSLSGNLLPFKLVKQLLAYLKLNFLKTGMSHLPRTIGQMKKRRWSIIIQLVLMPYIRDKRKELSLPDNFPALVLFDAFKGQTTLASYQLLENNGVCVVNIPTNCTDKLQPMDLSVNRSIKEFLKNKFGEWYSKMVFQYLDDMRRVPIDLRLSVMKPLNAKWLLEAHNYLKRNPTIITNGFKAAGIIDALEKVSI